MFFDDKDRPNRYLLAREMISRPVSEDLEVSTLIGHDRTGQAFYGYF